MVNKTDRSLASCDLSPVEEMHSGRLRLSRVPAHSLIPALLRAGVPTAVGHLQEEETEAAQGGKLLARAKSPRGA